MRTLGFLVSLCLVAGVLAAQPVANRINGMQSGEGHVAKVWQNGTANIISFQQAEGNEAELPAGMRSGFHYLQAEQSGNGNEAFIQQIGGENWVQSRQEGDRNLLEIQQGEDWLSAYGAVATIAQLGDGNKLQLLQHGTVSFEGYQEGIGNEAYIQQDILSNGQLQLTQLGENNVSHIYTDGYFKNTPYDFSLHQQGEDNHIQLAVTNGVRGEISQYGRRNTANLFMSYMPGGVAKIYQNGNDNFAELTHAFNTRVYQSGDYNSAVIFQREGAFASIRQEGNQQEAVIGQLEISGAHAQIDQKGVMNSGLIYQGLGNDYSADIRQDGQQNSAEISQGISAFTLAIIHQEGLANQAFIEQSYGSQDVQARIYQYGAYNTASIRQSGSIDGSVDQIWQYGYNNEAFIEHHTTPGDIRIIQRGNNQQAYVAQ